MAGLGLSDALMSFRDGMAWRQQQDDVERQQKQRATYDAANQAAADVLEASKAEWALNGAQGQYQPSDSTMLKSAEARGQAFAKGGDWESYLKNEAAVQGQRTRLRANALQRFEQDGDPVAFAQAVYPTVFDGREIVSVEKVGGMPALASIGRPATESAIRYKLSDGTEGEMPVAKMVGQVKSLLVDPVAAAQKEIELNFLRTKASIEAEKQKEVERTKGDEARKTEDLKGKNARGLADVKFGYDQQIEQQKASNAVGLANVNNAARKVIADNNDKTSLGVAATHAKATTTAAQIRADSSEGKNPRGTDGLTASERIRALQQRAITARDVVSSLNSQLRSPGLRAEDRKRVIADLQQANSNLQAVTKEIASFSPGLAQASPVAPNAPTSGAGLGSLPPLSNFMTK